MKKITDLLIVLAFLMPIPLLAQVTNEEIGNGAKDVTGPGVTDNTYGMIIYDDGCTIVNNGTINLYNDVVNGSSLIFDQSTTGTTITGTGWVRLVGNGGQWIYSLSAGALTIPKLLVFNPSLAGALYLGTLQISDTLSLSNGLLYSVGTSVLYVTNPAPGAIVNASTASYVVGGPLKRAVNSTGDYIFYVGDSTNLQIFEQNIISSAGLSWMQVQLVPMSNGSIVNTSTHFNGGTAFGNLDTCYWAETVNAGSSMVTTVTLQERNATNLPASPASIGVAHDVGAGYVGTNGGVNGTHNNGTQTIVGNLATAVKSNIPTSTTTINWLIAKNDAEPLPITITSFTGQNEGPANHLRLATESEINSQRIEFQKSDGADFKTFITLPAAGTSDQTIEYNAVDTEPYTLTYYRAVLIDIDGTNDTTDIIALRLAENENGDNLYPNPSMENPTLTVSTDKAQTVDLAITNVLGQEFTSSLVLTPGTNVFKLAMDGLASGMYLVTVRHDGKVFERKFVLER